MLELAPPGAPLALRLIDLRQQVDRLELEFSKTAVAFDESKFWDDDGSNSALDWIRFNCRMTSNAAADRIAVGEHLAGLAQSTQAMELGEIGFAHVTVMARTAEALGQRFDESKLLPLARENSPGKFYYKCLNYRHSVDAKAYAAAQNEQAENRSLHLSTVEDGSLLINGVLDPVGGAAVRTALEPLARCSGDHDGRLLDQRYADALVELAQGGKPANLQVTASVETLKGMAGAAGGEMEFSLPISSTAVQRMACDCSVTRVLLDQDSLVIDVGRTKRIVPGPMRRALMNRDGHCRWPGCERPASWCDGHHLVHWKDGGETNLDNLVLLCGRHHRMVHEGQWQLIKLDDGQIMTIAPTVTFRLPRGPG
jgi:hypothetical protein